MDEGTRLLIERFDQALARNDRVIERNTQAFERNTQAFERNARAWGRSVSAMTAVRDSIEEIGADIRAHRDALLRILDRLDTGEQQA